MPAWNDETDRKFFLLIIKHIQPSVPLATFKEIAKEMGPDYTDTQCYQHYNKAKKDALGTSRPTSSPGETSTPPKAATPSGTKTPGSRKRTSSAKAKAAAEQGDGGDTDDEMQTPSKKQKQNVVKEEQEEQG